MGKRKTESADPLVQVALTNADSVVPQSTPQWKIFDQLLDAIVIVDRNFAMYYANESFRHLADVPPRAIASREDAEKFLELPEECWDFTAISQTNSRTDFHGGYREVGFLAKNGVMGRAQVYTGKLQILELASDELFYLIVRDVTVEARLHAKYKVQIDNNERLIVDLQRGIRETSFLRSLATDLPIYAETSSLLDTITERLRKELGFREAHFFKLSQTEDSVETVGIEQRLGSRLRDVANKISSAMVSMKDDLVKGQMSTSLSLEPFGLFWLTKVKPRMESPFVLLSSPKPGFENVDHSAFLETLSGQLATLLDNRSLYYASITDPLTSLFNKRFFDSRFGIECLRAREKRIPLSLLLIDIDHFKLVNDQHGHQAGDAALSAIATMVKKRIRGSDVSARVGGEEFAILLPDTNAQDAGIVAQSLMQILEKADIFVPQISAAIKLTMSCGIAGFSWTTDDTESLFKAADEALYRAKALGRNRFVISDRSSNA